MNKSNHVTSKPTSKIILIVFAVVLLVLTAAYVWHKKTHKPVATTSPSSTLSTPTSSIPTYKAQTEGQSIDVPSNVDPSAIKNYTLITENEQYKIRELDGAYTITLYAIINHPDQADAYRDQLREYKQNALDYMKQKGIDITKVKITYEPQEAASL